jgi:hypothetical protein
MEELSSLLVLTMKLKIQSQNIRGIGITYKACLKIKEEKAM